MDHCRSRNCGCELEVSLKVLCYHVVMGGFPIVAIGYEVADEALERYQHQHHFAEVEQLLQYVESEISMPISLASLEDSAGLSRMFLCCYVDTHTRVYSCEELMAVTAPPQFTRVKEILGIDGDLKRVFAPRGTIVSCDVNGRTRIWLYLHQRSFGPPSVSALDCTSFAMSTRLLFLSYLAICNTDDHMFNSLLVFSILFSTVWCNSET
ncbi:hypothetical protein AZE42_03615 [Rhizopogon vesiculosus]|uniref:Uncharacterized protein n=1 Tax=Rhizopogon vesiculosus TaxID=180088 RepID=A0A1J8PXC3_9AGAM|nr:hypothetical protein AZE42_03615 [Rhizopogon vesiculosus]